MNNAKWKVLGFIVITIAAVFSGIIIVLSVISAISLKRYLHVPETNVNSEG
ncbi:hypothetical protein ABXS75_18695 [Roseburia hominis]